jgi:uncharacterized membrane protein
MVMIPCPDCGRTVSDAAPTCPACGRPIAMPRVAYGAPAPQFSAPGPQYGAPGQQYGAQGPSFGGPAGYYGAPLPDRLMAERSNLQTGYILIAVAFAIWPAMIVAGILGMTKRDALRGTWLESHAEWQMNTALVSFGLIVAGFFLFLFGSILFFPFGFMAIFAAGFGSLGWHIYRLVRGWTLLNEGKPAVGVLSPPRW